MNDKIEIDGYTVVVEQHEYPSNPFDDSDCEPPLLVYSHDRTGYLTSHNAFESFSDLLSLLPDSMFERGKRVELIKEFLDCGVKEFVEDYMRGGRGYWSDGFKDAFCEALDHKYGSKPVAWRYAEEWFETCERLLIIAGIPCHLTKSRGYCQGDEVILLAYAPQKWVDLVGAPVESIPKQLESACELYGQWCWGDVYGYSEILDPDGNNIGADGCWGFYGDDHENNGLLEHATYEINHHKKTVIETQMAEVYP